MGDSAGQVAAPAAQAQHVAFGVTIGAPAYVGPAPVVVFRGPGYYDGVYVRDYNGWRAHQVWLRDHRFDRDRRVGRQRGLSQSSLRLRQIAFPPAQRPEIERRIDEYTARSSNLGVRDPVPLDAPQAAE